MIISFSNLITGSFKSILSDKKWFYYAIIALELFYIGFYGDLFNKF